MSATAEKPKPATVKSLDAARLSQLVRDFDAGDKITASEAGRIENISPGAIGRRVFRGVKAGDGTKVYLEAIRLGYTLYTSRAALTRFWQTLAEKMPNRQSPAPSIRTPSQRQRSHDRAMAELKAKGIAVDAGEA